MSAQDHFNAANELFVEEEFEAAATEYDKAINLDSSKATYFVARASNRLKLKNYLDVVADCTKAKQLDAKNSKASFKLGYIIFLRLNWNERSSKLNSKTQQRCAVQLG